jgi:hypothetical protein
VKRDQRAPVYCLDACALVDIWLCYPKAMKDLRRYASDGRVVIPEGVYREVCRKTDRLKSTVETMKKKYNAVIFIDSMRLQSELRQIEIAYGERFMVGNKAREGFWRSKSGKRSADGQVITICKVHNYIAVSNDRAIQDACHIENVPCIGWQEFYRRMSQGFSGQAALFE